MISANEAFEIAKKVKKGDWTNPSYMEYEGKHCFCDDDPTFWVFIDSETGKHDLIDTGSILMGLFFGDSSNDIPDTSEYDKMVAAMKKATVFNKK